MTLRRERWCAKNKVKFTRSRPYRKNDNAHIEQKNWTHVRRIFGWDRYDSHEQLTQMNALYRAELHHMQNFFQPCVRLKEKTRVGSRLRRRYDAAQTPLDRLVAFYGNSPIPLAVQKLLEMRECVDPFTLATRIEHSLDRLTRTVRQTPLKNVD